jgi:hypothetical protein
LKNKVTWSREDFAGVWTVAREIADAAGQQTGRFDGQAVLRPEGEAGLVYAEEGVLRMGAGPGWTATRTYLWSFDPAGVTVRFADGRAFHAFVFGAAEAKHLCGADIYRVRYDFAHWPVWTAQWDVRGPRKDYAMVSQYRRPGDASGR